MQHEREGPTRATPLITDALWAVISVILTLVVLCLDFAMWPHTGTCPRAGYVDGVEPSGAYRCRIPFGCMDVRGPRGGWTSDCDGALEYWRRVHCEASERAVVDLRGIVRCQLAN
jgi:hypothetical protein